jgi:hypothetical protein
MFRDAKHGPPKSRKGGTKEGQDFTEFFHRFSSRLFWDPLLGSPVKVLRGGVPSGTRGTEPAQMTPIKAPNFFVAVTKTDKDFPGIFARAVLRTLTGMRNKEFVFGNSQSRLTPHR